VNIKKNPLAQKSFKNPEDELKSYIGTGQGRALTGLAKGLRASQSAGKRPTRFRTTGGGKTPAV